MKVNSNIQAMIAQNILHSNEKRFQSATEKMSSGYKINTAIDNPSGMAITNKMNAQLRSLKKANQNTSNAINVCQTADGAYSEVEAMLQRMNELAIKASNGTMTSSDRLAIQSEVDQLTSEIKRIGKNTDYNTQAILDGTQDLKGYTNNPDLKVRSYNSKFPLHNDYEIEIKVNSASPADIEASIEPNIIDAKGKSEVYYVKDSEGNDTEEISFIKTTFTTRDGGELIVDTKGAPSGSTVNADVKLEGIGGMKIQSGTAEHQEIQVVIPAISLKHLGIGDMDDKSIIDMRTEDGAKDSISKITEAISYVSAARSKVGAFQNRLESTLANIETNEENLTGSYSTIKDLDMAEEMVNYTTLQVLVQAGTSMLTQANEQPQQALQLLQ